MERSEINTGEVFRYLGIRTEPDDRTRSLVERVLGEYLPLVRERTVSRSFGCETDGRAVTLLESDGKAAARFESADLARALSGCTGAVLFAATLGAECDRLMLRYEVNELAAAAAAQACGAACIERLCDCFCDTAQRDAREQGLYTRPRFSPGYGDFDLSAQKTVFELLQCQKKIGLTLTSSLQMTPSKSVSAIIGLSPSRHCGAGRGCGECSDKECEFRR